MYRVYETDKCRVVITNHLVSIDGTFYAITGEQQSIGEWEDWDTQNIDAFEVTNLNTNEKYYFELFYHRDTLPDENCYSYRLRSIA